MVSLHTIPTGNCQLGQLANKMVQECRTIRHALNLLVWPLPILRKRTASKWMLCSRLVYWNLKLCPCLRLASDHLLHEAGETSPGFGSLLPEWAFPFVFYGITCLMWLINWVCCYSPLVKNTCVRQVVLEKRLPLTHPATMSRTAPSLPRRRRGFLSVLIALQGLQHWFPTSSTWGRNQT